MKISCVEQCYCSYVCFLRKDLYSLIGWKNDRLGQVYYYFWPPASKLETQPHKIVFQPTLAFSRTRVSRWTRWKQRL
jgi:hypothetical protein